MTEQVFKFPIGTRLRSRNAKAKVRYKVVDHMVPRTGELPYYMLEVVEPGTPTNATLQLGKTCKIHRHSPSPHGDRR